MKELLEKIIMHKSINIIFVKRGHDQIVEALKELNFAYTSEPVKIISNVVSIEYTLSALDKKMDHIHDRYVIDLCRYNDYDNIEYTSMPYNEVDCTLVILIPESEQQLSKIFVGVMCSAKMVVEIDLADNDQDYIKFLKPMINKGQLMELINKI